MKVPFQFFIPFFKEYQYLEKCLESIVNQTITDWEALVIDDQAEDNDFCDSVINKFGDSRIKVIRKNERGSISDSWNFALKHAIPGLVTIFHADDLMDPCYVENMMITQVISRMQPHSLPKQSR